VFCHAGNGTGESLSLPFAHEVIPVLKKPGAVRELWGANDRQIFWRITCQIFVGCSHGLILTMPNVVRFGAVSVMSQQHL